jgi:hypothetical protein
MAIFTDSTIFKSTSRFKLTELIQYNSHLTPAMMKRFDFLDRDKLGTNNIIKIEINGSRAGRPDLISNDIYGTTIFKWVLLIFNNVENPFDGWPVAGSVIEAPNRPSVWREL